MGGEGDVSHGILSCCVTAMRHLRRKLGRVNFRKDFWDWRVPSNDPRHNCGMHFGSSLLLISKVSSWVVALPNKQSCVFSLIIHWLVASSCYRNNKNSTKVRKNVMIFFSFFNVQIAGQARIVSKIPPFLILAFPTPVYLAWLLHQLIPNRLCSCFFPLTQIVTFIVTL